MKVSAYEQDKEELIMQVRKAKYGDKEAFCNLIRINKVAIYRIAKSILIKEEDIEDAVSEAILKAYKNIKTLKNDDFFKTWLIRILINECNLILRRNKKTIFLDKLENEESYSDDYGNIELTSVVNSLSEDLRITTVLYYFEDMSTKEISEMLNIAEGTVRSRLSRAREKLREIMSEV